MKSQYLTRKQCIEIYKNIEIESIIDQLEFNKRIPCAFGTAECTIEFDIINHGEYIEIISAEY